MKATTTSRGLNPRPRNLDAGVADYAEQLAEARSALAEMKDKLLRSLAEAENVRKRAQRKRRGRAGKYAASSFAKDMLDVADNLRRALSSAPDEGQWDELSRNLLTGVAATERELQAAFERHGIRRIEPRGERFRP